MEDNQMRQWILLAVIQALFAAYLYGAKQGTELALELAREDIKTLEKRLSERKLSTLPSELKECADPDKTCPGWLFGTSLQAAKSRICRK